MKNDEEKLDPIDAEAELQALEASGAKVTAFTVPAGSGGMMLRGLVSMFEHASENASDDPEELRGWWRSFVMEAHLIGLEHIGMSEALDSLKACAVRLHAQAAETKAPH